MDATQASLVAHSADMPAKATEDQMLRWLSAHYRGQGWAAIPQVTVAAHDLVATGNTLAVPEGVTDIRDRRIDLLIARRAKNEERCGPLETMAIEVKVSRADFLSDIKDPSKQAPWRQAATRHAYAVPAGLVMPEEVPEGSGLVWLSPPAYAHGMPTVEWVTRAPFIPGHKPRLPFRVLIAVLHRLSTFECSTRGWFESQVGQKSEQDLRAELAAARLALERAERTNDRNELLVQSWRLAYGLAAPDGVPCKWCGEGLKPLNPRDGGFRSWKHAKEHVEACEKAEQRLVEQEALDAFDAATDVEREREVRNAHRYGFKPDAEATPWRAYLPYGWKPSPVPADAPISDPVTGAVG